MPPSAPTMEDVARAAGVHQTTVSRALRNDRRLSEDTRQRVQRVASQLGYHPHPLLSVLGANLRRRTQTEYQATLAYIMAADQPGQCRREHVAGARQAADEQGFRLEEFVLGAAGFTESRLDEILRARTVHGVVLAPLPAAHGHYTLSWSGFCTTVIEYTFNEPAFDRIVHDSYGAMRLTLQQCRERRLARVGVLLTTTGHERTEGTNVAAYWLEQRAPGSGFADIPPLVVPDWEADEFARWFETHRPEVILTSQWLLTHVAGFARAAGLEIPRDLSLINLNARTDQAYSGIVQDNHAIGRCAVQMVIEKIKRNDCGVPPLPRTVLISGQWFEGGTLRST